MKLTFILLTTFFLQVSAKSYSQNVTFSGKDISLQIFFDAITKQTGYTIFCNYDLLKSAKKISLDLKNTPIEAAIEECLKNQPLSYTIIEKTIVIKAKEATVGLQPADSYSAPPPTDIHGRVTDSSGNPLVGASVTVKGGKKGTQTDSKGYFILNDVPENSTLIISYTGYINKQYKVSGNESLTIFLDKSSNPLDEVQVIAYGTTSQRLSTGDVSTVSGADIEKQPVDNPMLALEGRVTGVFITQSTGLPGGGVVVQIQGQNSILNGNDPFYVIDEVPYTSQLLPGLDLGGFLGYSSVNNYQSGNPLNYINPDDIESISVLKGADATAIYGSRAANGAILITTKKGKAGQTKVDIHLQDGWGNVTRKMKMMDTQQYLQMRHEAKSNDGLPTYPTDYDINGLWDTTRNTDWQKTLIGGTSQYTDVDASMSGGNSNTQYLVAGNYQRQTTVFPGNFSDRKGSIHFNINSTSNNQKLKLQFSGLYMVDDNELPNIDYTGIAMQLAPDAPPLYNADGSLNWQLNPAGSSTWTNPLSNLYNTYSNKTNNLISNAVLSYQILPGLNFKSNFGYTNLQSNQIVIGPLIAIAPQDRPYVPRNAQYGNNNINSWIIEPQLNYKRTIGIGKLDVLLGTTIQENNSNGQQLYASGYNSDLVLGDIRSAANVAVTSTIASVYKYNALFGRVNYNWDDKYLINLTARRDGSSRFGPENQFHNFAAIGLGWIFSSEKFFKTSLSAISFGKIRASYGTTGNDQIGDYGYLSLYSPTTEDVPYQGATGLAPNNLSNPYLQWEQTKKIELGLDLGLFKDRILLTANYFNNKSSNQLLQYSLPIITGFPSIIENFPATVQNTGLELTLNTVNIKSKTFSWNTSFNITIPSNKLISFPNFAASSYSSTLEVGKPITIIKAFHFLGVDPATGQYQFADSHGNPTFTPDPTTDNTQVVNTGQQFYGGLENTFNYKGFQLEILFQFVKQLGPNFIFGNSLPGVKKLNQPDYVLNRWQEPGNVTSTQRYNSDYSLVSQFSNAFASDARWSDASFVRLKNLSLSWQFPTSWKKSAHLQNAALFIHAQNLLTITKYEGLDPENRSANMNALPPLRIVTVGINLTL